MSDAKLDEHARRVTEAQRKLAGDVERISEVGRQVRARATRGTTVALVLGSVVLLGALTARQMYRNARSRAVLVVPRTRPTLARELLRALLFALAQPLGRYLGSRLLARALSVPQLAGGSSPISENRPPSPDKLPEPS